MKYTVYHQFYEFQRHNFGIVNENDWYKMKASAIRVNLLQNVKLDSHLKKIEGLFYDFKGFHDGRFCALDFRRMFWTLFTFINT